MNITAKAEALIEEHEGREGAEHRVRTLKDWIKRDVDRLNSLEARIEDQRNELTALEAALLRTA